MSAVGHPKRTNNNNIGSGLCCWSIHICLSHAAVAGEWPFQWVKHVSTDQRVKRPFLLSKRRRRRCLVRRCDNFKRTKPHTTRLYAHIAPSIYVHVIRENENRWKMYPQSARSIEVGRLTRFMCLVDHTSNAREK